MDKDEAEFHLREELQYALASTPWFVEYVRLSNRRRTATVRLTLQRNR